MMSKIEEAAEAVAKQRKQVEEIRAAIAEQQKIVSSSELRRQPFVLQAARGDVAAKSALDKLLHEDLVAERTLSDLRLALPQAESELQTAENAQKATEAEARKTEIHRLVRRRVASAQKIDEALAVIRSEWPTYQQLGGELLNLASDTGNALYLAETVDGVARFISCLPPAPFLAVKESYRFMSISTSKSSFAAAEAAYWRLPPAEADKAA
jgi:hypothetical protein